MQLFGLFSYQIEMENEQLKKDAANQRKMKIQLEGG